MSNNKALAILLFIAFLVFLGWVFSDILIYMFIALILSLLGSPLVKLLMKIRIKNWHLPQTAAAVITFFVIIGVVTSFIYILIPFVSNEVAYLASIDPTVIEDGIANWLPKIEKQLRNLGFLHPHEHLVDIVVNKIRDVVTQISYATVFGDTIGFIASVFIAIFSILFMTFFSLKDNKILFKVVKKIIPTSYRNNFDNILSATRVQLVRYFSGVFLEMIIMGIMEGLLCYFLGVPNPILIGCIGGFLNIIPYVGPLIATGLSIVISITAIMPLSPDNALISVMLLKVVVAFVVSKLIDDFVLQPIIYGKSIQAHPLEIFIIILVAAKVGGVFGMIFAVPAYSLVRIIIKEFFGQYYYDGSNIKPIDTADKRKEIQEEQKS